MCVNFVPYILNKIFKSFSKKSEWECKDLTHWEEEGMKWCLCNQECMHMHK